MISKRGCLTWLFFIFLIGALIWAGLPVLAGRTYGPPSERLSAWQRVKYSALVLWHDGLLTQPAQPDGAATTFTIASGESVDSIAARLEAAGLIREARAFRDYLIYAGLDTTLQAGQYQISPQNSALAIARQLQDATPTQIKLVVLPGWRLEEIAASLPTSGLDITPVEFMQAASQPAAAYDFLPPQTSAEGFCLPNTYTLPRNLDASHLVETLIQNFALHLTHDLRDGFARQGLTVYQAVTLASIVQKESVLPEEMPLIASVFYNRLRTGMKLESDPTVQYAVGYDADRGGWWPVPLTQNDLDLDSAYNTYRYAGLPPGPIASPSLNALQAVAYPAETPYFFFRAACDGSGAHRFAETYEEHLQNACP